MQSNYQRLHLWAQYLMLLKWFKFLVLIFISSVKISSYQFCCTFCDWGGSLFPFLFFRTIWGWKARCCFFFHWQRFYQDCIRKDESTDCFYEVRFTCYWVFYVWLFSCTKLWLLTVFSLMITNLGVLWRLREVLVQHRSLHQTFSQSLQRCEGPNWLVL